MIAGVLFAGTFIAAVGCGLMAGLFFVFSTFMMTSLGRLPAAQGMAAMRQINADILNPLFGLLFGGTTVACLALAVAVPFTADEPGSWWRLAGGLLYVLGCFGVTVVVNVPLNNRLAAADPESADGQQLWAFYLRRWTAWNHLRTVCCTAAMINLLFALTA